MLLGHLKRLLILNVNNSIFSQFLCKEMWTLLYPSPRDVHQIKDMFHFSISLYGE